MIAFVVQACQGVEVAPTWSIAPCRCSATRRRGHHPRTGRDDSEQRQDRLDAPGERVRSRSIARAEAVQMATRPLGPPCPAKRHVRPACCGCSWRWPPPDARAPMLTRFLAHGTGSARKAADYLIGARDATGKPRESVEVLCGDANLYGRGEARSRGHAVGLKEGCAARLQAGKQQCYHYKLSGSPARPHRAHNTTTRWPSPCVGGWTWRK